MQKYALCTLLICSIASAASAAEPSNTVSVRARSDAPGSVLYNDAWSVRTTGDSQQSVHGTEVCTFPCKVSLSRDRNYVVRTPGMQDGRVSIPYDWRAAELDVRTANAAQPVAGNWALGLGVAGALAGGSFWLLDKNDSAGLGDAPQAVTYISAGLVVLGSALLLTSSKTHVDARRADPVDHELDLGPLPARM